MHQTSLDLFQKFAISYFTPGMLVLEMGPGEIPSGYLGLLQTAGINVDWHYADAFIPPAADPRRIGMKSAYEIDSPAESFDVVFHGQVLEHVEKIWRWIPETARVLKTGGIMCIIVPAAWGHHAYPVDCWRIYSDGMRALLEDSGVRCDFSQHFVYGDGSAETVSIGTKVGPPLVGVL